MYEIAKYRVDADGEQQYVQSIFLPICDKDNLSYYDTQVIPYQDYFYKIRIQLRVLNPLLSAWIKVVKQYQV